VNLDMVINILSLDGQKQRSEPFERSEISANPEEVDLPETRAALGVVHPVPDTLQDGRERRDTDTSTYEHGDFKFEHILGG
jgi:hypothetical protein